MAQKVLLTGISGFIGGHIALQLFQRGYHVVGAVRDEEDIGFVRGYLRPHIDGSELAEKLTFVVADLLKRDDWRAAMEGCHAVIHTASPIPNIMPNDEDLIIRPAVDGTRNVLRAASSAGISRVVMTSSITAISEGHRLSEPRVFTEDDWSDLNAGPLTAYAKSKTLAERAAWEIANTPECPFTLTTMHPGVTLGPVLNGRTSTSVASVWRLMSRLDPLLPNFGFPYVDVRDVARLHVDALETEAANGQRIALTNGFVWYPDLAAKVSKERPDLNIVSRRAFSWFLRLLAPFKTRLKLITPNLDRHADVSNANAKAIFSTDFVPFEQTLADTIESLEMHNAKK